jgi:hypothetical protein
MLLRKRSDHFIMPHIFYNFIYRKTSIPEVTADSKLTGDKASYTSMEHHAGMGVKMKITSSIYADCDLGYGAYLGSIKKPSLPDPLTGEISGTNGFGMIFKIGLGCYLF